ncbi:MAG: hypothetical protein ACE5GN_05295 [Waddliaceae bacterium]
MINPENKKVLYFDLDETLFFVEQFGEQGLKRASDSAQEDVSVSGPGVVGGERGVVLERTRSGTLCGAQRVRAFALEEFRKIFQRIDAINRAAGETVIFLRFLTNASYTKNEILSVFWSLYGMPLRLDGFQNRFRFSDKTVFRPPPKGYSMLDDFDQEYQRLGISKKKIYLIDDSYENCQMASELGFNVICMQTNPKTRRAGETYTQNKTLIFKTLNEILDEVDSSLQDCQTN